MIEKLIETNPVIYSLKNPTTVPMKNNIVSEHCLYISFFLKMLKEYIPFQSRF